MMVKASDLEPKIGKLEKLVTGLDANVEALEISSRLDKKIAELVQ